MFDKQNPPQIYPQTVTMQTPLSQQILNKRNEMKNYSLINIPFFNCNKDHLGLSTPAKRITLADGSASECFD